jgi:hypothetical protein
MADATHVTTSRAAALTEALFSLEEPWRTRFLYLLATRATESKSGEEPPTREEVTTWLEDGSLQEATKLLLEIWREPCCR